MCISLQDQEATATEVVTRKVRETDPTISDEKARSALGALGLIGEKAIRKVGHLSGKGTLSFSFLAFLISSLVLIPVFFFFYARRVFVMIFRMQ
jgi:hypothetical protein